MAKKFIVETSARHVHLTDADLEVLFGKGAKLTPKKDLSQPGQFACEERVDLVGPKKTIARVSVLGPTRSHTQIEVSLTDARTLGVTADPASAAEMGVKDKDIVKVKLDTEGRALIFDDVVVRVSDKYALAMHIDTDEGNAAACSGEVFGEIVK